MNLAAVSNRGTMAVPFRLLVLPAVPSFESIGRGFLFALKSCKWYHVHQSPRNGKLLATWTTLKRCKRCSHRSGDATANTRRICSNVGTRLYFGVLAIRVSLSERLK